MDASKPIVISSPEIMSGAPVFAGTRVPVRTLVEYLAAGDSIDEFLEGFPTVSRDQVLAFLDRAEALVCGGARR
jgi:uncharacterized protein (DUF433 family)